MFRNRSTGFWLAFTAAIIALIVAVVYTIFGISSSTFNPITLVGLIITAVAGAVFPFVKGIIADLLPVAMSALLSLSFTSFLGNSIGDITEFITPTGLFGVAENVPIRGVIAGLILVAVAFSVIGSFLKTEKD